MMINLERKTITKPPTISILALESAQQKREILTSRDDGAHPILVCKETLDVNELFEMKC
jgi:hypothetical protein